MTWRLNHLAKKVINVNGVTANIARTPLIVGIWKNLLVLIPNIQIAASGPRLIVIIVISMNQLAKFKKMENHATIAQIVPLWLDRKRVARQFKHSDAVQLNLKTLVTEMKNASL
jgi:hypothetical protein